MAVRMSQTIPQVADTASSEEAHPAPRVRILVTMVRGADLDAALSVVRRQVYEPAPDVVVVGAEVDGFESAASLEEAIASTDSSYDYFWLLHADARPRPDALSALVSEVERTEAALAGSKLLKAGTMDELESVGGATDVFGEPYTGIDTGEIDLQQYDVVREVAFVQSASMLVRRDLAQGLRGLDPLLPPVAAGLDFSQRARLAGGRVITVPSSEVYHQARCGERGEGRREQAGRLRALITAYSPLTLLWVLPYDFLVSVLDSLANLLFLRWRPAARYAYSWLWNLIHLPSTIKQRRRLKTVRSERDEELFRFHAKGSVRLRAIGEELGGKVLSVFDDDQALARGTRRIGGAPGIWGALLAVAVAFLAARSIVFRGMPSSGFDFPFEAPSIALPRWLAGWNEAGMGSPSPVHPITGVTGLASFLWFGAEDAARLLLTVLLPVIGIVGMGRLGGSVGLRGAGRYLSGLVLMAGPGVALLTGRGSWTALAAAAFLPWAARAVFIHPHRAEASRFSRYGWAVVTGCLLAACSPLLVLVPIFLALVWKALGGARASILLALAVVLGGVVGVGYVLGDTGWLTDATRRISAPIDPIWLGLIIVGSVALALADPRIRVPGLAGGVLSTAALAGASWANIGPGTEEALLVAASFGAALIAAAGLEALSRSPLRLLAGLASLVMVVVSIVAMGNGRLGMPDGDVNGDLAFASALAGEAGPGRILLASMEREAIPGEVRSGPGYWYRVVDGTGTTNDEVWLAEPLPGDDELGAALDDITAQADLRPGARLAPYAIEWVVISGPHNALDDALVTQLDLEPVPLDPEARVFRNVNASPLASAPDAVWETSGLGFVGEPTPDRVDLALNFDGGWGPEPEQAAWGVSASGADGSISYRGGDIDLALAIAAVAVLAAGLISIVVGRVRS